MPWYRDPQWIVAIANGVTDLILLSLIGIMFWLRLFPRHRSKVATISQKPEPLDPYKWQEMDVVKYYDFLRQNIIHLDTMIDRRIVWLLTVHGFLFTGFGLSIQKGIEVTTKCPNGWTLGVCRG